MTLNFGADRTALTTLLAGASTLMARSGRISVDNYGVSQNGCVTVLGENCSLAGSIGSFSLGQPGVLGPAPTEAVYSYSDPRFLRSPLVAAHV